MSKLFDLKMGSFPLEDLDKKEGVMVYVEETDSQGNKIEQLWFNTQQISFLVAEEMERAATAQGDEEVT